MVTELNIVKTPKQQPPTEKHSDKTKIKITKFPEDITSLKHMKSALDRVTYFKTTMNGLSERQDMLEIPGYVTQRLLGKGGTARVYLALQDSLGRHVAIKILDDSSDIKFNQRFINEARLIANINHPKIITIHDIATLTTGEHYIVMEYLQGGDLNHRQQAFQDPNTALDVIKQVAEALTIVHDKGIVHRDIKPSNILFREDGTAVLTDFGIAKDLTMDSDLTQMGIAVGSPSYSSPEQAQGKAVDPRTDIYSLGVIFLEMLTGDNPFRGDTPTDTMINQIQMTPPVLPVRHHVFKPLMDKMLAKDPDQRFANCYELLQALKEIAPIEIMQDHESDKTLLSSPVTIHLPRKLPRAIDFAKTALSKFTAFGPKLATPIVLLMLFTGLLAFTGLILYLRAESETHSPQQAQEQKIQQQIELFLQQAEQHLAAGQLVEPKNDNAKFYYEKVLSFDKDNIRAQQGLAEVTEQHIEVLINRGNERIEKQKLLIPQNDSAHYYFSQVLQLQPDNSAASKGMDRIVEEYLTLATHALQDQHFAESLRLIERGLSINSQFEPLLNLKKQAEQQQQNVQAEGPKKQPSAVNRFFKRIFKKAEGNN